jgi:tetratricopeptide (TPR) repeat protein/predicted Ser/Thr protein kinase
MVQYTVIADRFEIERLAGQGGMGAVYKARDKGTGERVAVKLMSVIGDADRQRFEREARVLSELCHPGIVRYVDHGVTPSGEPYLVMEWLDGEDLGERLANGRLPVGEALTLVSRVADALAVAHARGIVHRDIKPSNLYLPAGDIKRVKLLDFGIARQAQKTRALTRTGAMLGTPGYMAPEQARGEKHVDSRADVFALGCVLFECLTGRLAFEGEHVMAVLAKILFDETPSARALQPDVPAALDRLVARMLAKSPPERPSDGRAVAEEIAQIAISKARGHEPSNASHARSATRVQSLTGGEQQVVSVILTSGMPEQSALAEAPTLAPEELSGAAARLREAAQPFGAKVEALADGSFVAVLTNSSGATDQAAQAARAALSISALMPELRLVLATGRAVVTGGLPLGAVIERAAKLLHESEQSWVRGGVIRARSRILIDDVTGGLLGERFEAIASDVGMELLKERESAPELRTLLGRPTPCLGRDWELTTLRALFTKCVEEPCARAVLVTGAPGIGKSRLRYELLCEVSRRDELASVWLARGDPMRKGSPFGLVADMLKRAAEIRDSEPVDDRRRKLRSYAARNVLGADVARVTAFLGEIVGTPWPEEESPFLPAARGDPVLMRDQIRRAWEDLALAECEARPVVMVLEDLHWGDIPSVQLIDTALRLAKSKPLFVLALARPELHDIFPKLWVEREVQEMRLGELSRRASMELVRKALGPRATPGTVERVAAQAAGNAFYLEELIRAVAEGKGQVLPETVLAMVQSRLLGLDVEARRLLRAASVFGQTFWRGGIEALLGDSSIGTILEALEGQELISRRRAGRLDAEYAFRHALLREAAYEMLTEEDRALGHRLAGAWLEQVGELEAMTLAEHFERGGEPARAGAWYRRAAEHALEGGDLNATLDRANRAIACGATGEALGAIRLLQTYVSQWQGRPAEAEKYAAEAMLLLPVGGELWHRAVSEIAKSFARLGKQEPLAALGTQMLELSRQFESLEPAAIISLSNLALSLSTVDKYDIARLLHDRIELAAARMTTPDLKVSALIDKVRAYHAYFVDEDLEKFLDFTHRSTNSHERVGDLRNACQDGANLGFAYFAIGAYSDATEVLRKVVSMAKQMDLESAAAAARLNLGLALAHVGALDEARHLEEEALRSFQAQGDRRMEAAARLYLATIYLKAGDLGSAERQSQLSLDVLPATSSARVHAFAMLALARLGQGRIEGARSTVREMMSSLDSLMVTFESLGDSADAESTIRLAFAEVVRAAGETEAARDAIRAARDRLLTRAAKFRSPARRDVFLRNVPENARTLELARAWLDEGGS